MIFSAALRWGAEVLAAAGIEDSRWEARMLLHHLLNMPNRSIPAPDVLVDEQKLRALLARRAAREPMAFIRGRQGFWTLDLAVSPATLIPRADSETLIHAALATLTDRAAVRTVLDLGTGTGALLLAALTEFPQAWGVGVDLSPAAAALAAGNARGNGLSDRSSFLCGHWATALDRRFDLILANPPYIASADIAGLMPEVARHEPGAALDGGADGLEAYREIIPDLPRLLGQGGVAILELGVGQADPVKGIAAAAGFASPLLRCDLGGIARALVLRQAA